MEKQTRALDRQMFADLNCQNGIRPAVNLINTTHWAVLPRAAPQCDVMAMETI